MTKRRPALGSDPLDAFISAPPPAGRTAPARTPRAANQNPAPTASARRTATKATKSTNSSSTTNAPAAPAPQLAAPKRAKATFNLDPALVGECRAAVVALAGAPLRLTLSALVERALRTELDRLKREHHGGKAFPAHGAPLVGGRPLKTPER